MNSIEYEKEVPRFKEFCEPMHIEMVSISFSPLESLDGIDTFVNLKNLQIHYCRKLRDLSAISRLKNLELLNIYCTPNIEVVFDIARLKTLKMLSFNNVAKLETIKGIEKLPNLKELGLSRVKVLDGDYEPIVNCANLKSVFWFGGPFKAPALKTIRNRRPDMMIGGNAVHNKV